MQELQFAYKSVPSETVHLLQHQLNQNSNMIHRQLDLLLVSLHLKSKSSVVNNQRFK